MSQAKHGCKVGLGSWYTNLQTLALDFSVLKSLAKEPVNSAKNTNSNTSINNS